MKEEYESIIKMCQELLDKGPVEPEFGICSSLDRRNGREYIRLVNLIDDIIKTWPKYSGSCIYPIPCDGTDYTDPLDCFNSTENLWEGVQGELRRDLLRFLIEQCKRAILNLSFPERDIGPFRALLVE